MIPGAERRHLNAALMKFNEGITHNKGVIQAYEEEARIGDVTYQINNDSA